MTDHSQPIMTPDGLFLPHEWIAEKLDWPLVCGGYVAMGDKVQYRQHKSGYLVTLSASAETQQT